MKAYKIRIAEQVSEIYPSIPKEDIVLSLETPPQPDMGDMTLPCFPLSKLLRRSPLYIAEELKEQLQLDFIERKEAVAGYMNMYFDKMSIGNDVVTDILTRREHYGSQTVGHGKTIVIDYSSPNIAKPFHIAHLRSTVIGHSLYRIFSFQGYQCIGINHLGDWGTQFGKLITSYRLWGNADAVEKGGIDELLRLYVVFHEEAEKQPDLENEARRWFAKMEQGDPEALQLWEWFVDISLTEFRRTYHLLGVSFDSYAGESFYNDQMGAVIEELKAKGLLVEDDGAWLVRLDEYELPPALLVKQDGSSLYHMRDITAALYRKKTYDFDKAIYVTDYAQNLHFQQWFKVIERMGYEWANELVHVAFGRVRLEGRGLSTRKGNVLKLEDVLQQAIAKVKSIIEERNPSLRNKEEVARAVGVGAVIFHDLSMSRIKDIDFSWEEALQFEGETGPYVQFTHARASQVLKKAYRSRDIPASDVAVVPIHLADETSYQLIKDLSMFGDVVERAMEKLEPSIVTRYLIDLAQQFNRFYHEHHILVEDAEVLETRLALVKCVQITLKDGLWLIGIEAPKEM
ncbi:arginine--tRNA ligase [Paenibacillus chartarius]|uniref:Arginine--tRNA ligase n=1 Tax=Paenibacillus chartarius TaxID=747481 RepID=A0ABV6DVM3_9BACL